MNYKTLTKKVTGDLVILGQKDTCKTTLLMHLARELREDPKNHVIVFETFPKWVHEFDEVPYMTIADSDVQPKENMPVLEEGQSYIQWTKDFTILNGETVIEFLKENKDCVFLIECEDMEKISAFMTFVIYWVYRKQYLRAKAGNLDVVGENWWFMVEESHNLLDSTVIAKKTFNKLRKIQNEFRNLRMHMVCVALRLQDLSPKIRSKMSILLSKISLDDYQLKIRNLLRNSKFRNEITGLKKGLFVFPELDRVLKTEPFQRQGKPYEWIPKPKAEPKQEKPSKLDTLKGFLKMPFVALQWFTGPTRSSPHITHGNRSSTEEEENEDYTCPSCGQTCTKEEYESGYCLDCDQVELFGDFEKG
jgi:hypothetical protein